MKKLFDVPKIVWLAIFGGNILIGFFGYQAFAKFSYINPLLLEILVLLGLDILLLVIRAFYPKFWKFLTTEDVDGK